MFVKGCERKLQRCIRILAGNIIFVNTLNITKMKERLAQFLKSEELTAVKFAEIMEVQPSSISHLLAGRNKPNFEFISRMLLRFPELNPDWIINGQGEMYKGVKTSRNDLFTDVKQEGITDVIQAQIEDKPKEITDVTTESQTLKEVNDVDSEPEKSVITTVNIQKQSVEVEREREAGERASKSIERIVLFYSDGSFDEYHN